MKRAQILFEYCEEHKFLSPDFSNEKNDEQSEHI
jgi:hypothetical protein